MMILERNYSSTSLVLERVANDLRKFNFDFLGSRPGRSADRWILSSNLQKAIRRGLSSTAALTAHWLHSVDPIYTWQRLLLIAYEDVSIGDRVVCLDLLNVYRRTAFQASHGPARMAAYFATRLATAVKNRALCDLSVVLEVEQQRNDMRSGVDHLSLDAQIELACDASKVGFLKFSGHIN